jgi:alpha-beta hydrolase superfamily lysophospholipase
MASRVDPARGAVAAGVVAAGALVTGALTARTARRMASPRPQRATPVRAVDLASGTIRFGPTPDSLLPGRYSFWFAEGRGHARIGPIIGSDGDGVLRELLGVDAGDLTQAREGRFNGWMWLTPEPFGVPYRSERVQTTQGAVPAWLVPAPDRPREQGPDTASRRPGTGERGPDRWAILVHGRASVRQEALRAVPAFLAAGWSVLLPAYRGDGEAPEGDVTRYAVTDGEWVDIESAILHALDEGATEVVLVGWSSGASIVLATAHRSKVREVIRGVVLDSPVLDGAQALLARGAGMPEPVRRGALSLLTSPWGRLVGSDALDVDPAVSADPAELDVPVLVLQSEDDGVAPPEVARRFAEARPDLVRLVPFSGARHTRLWNLDPARWEGAVTAWLADDERALAAISDPASASARRGDPSRPAAARRATRARPAL